MNRAFLLIILIGVIPLFDLFHPGLPVTHDGQDHVARIANFYQNLTEGNIIPRWAGNLNWGYGHPILMFLYPLPSYIVSLFHIFGFSLVDSTKIVFGLAFILSGVTMYMWIQSFLGKSAGLVAGILYMFAPYRFVDLYVRGAIGEHVAFVFPPLVFYFLFKLSKKFSKWYVVGGSLSLAGLLLSHNAISLMFMPLIFLYEIYLVVFSAFTSEEPKSLLRHLRGGTKSLLGGGVLIILLGFCLSAFFWIPAFFEGKYTLRDIVTSGEYSSRLIDEFKNFIYGEWSYGGTGEFSVQVGVIHWLLVIFSIPTIYFLYKKRSKLFIFSVGCLIVFFSTLILMMPYSRIIWENITILQKFQFPWRFLSVAVFSIAVLSGLFVYLLPNRFKSFIVFCFVVLLLFFNKDFWHAKGYLQKSESFFTDIYYGTTDTGESAPIWSVRFMLEEPKAPMEVIEGSAKITQLKRNSTSRLYTVDVLSKSRLRENTLYFPGWEVYVDGVKIKDVEFQDPANRGLMTFFVERGKHNIEIKFGETKLRLFADMVSAASLAIIISLFFYKAKRRFI